MTGQQPLDAVTAGEFVRGFVGFWNKPSAARLGDHLHRDVILSQPLSAPMHGLDAARTEFERILRWLPDLRGDVDRWTHVDDIVFIEFRLSAKLGNETVEWPVVDKFVVRDGKAVRRVSYFDPLPLLTRVIRHPSSWPGWLRSGAARPWRAVGTRTAPRA